MPDYPNRKSATILFTDMVAYSRLMEANEADALRNLKYFKEILEQQAAFHKGEIVQYYGDGALVVFEHPEQALHCAKALQQALLDPLNVPVRVGVHSGKVVFEEGNVFGDAVNIASRLEGMGVAGTVFVSEQVKKSVENQAAFSFFELGFFKLKNIKTAVKVFALANPPLTIPSKQDIQRKMARPTNFLDSRIGQLILGLGILALILVLGASLQNSWGPKSIAESQLLIPEDKSIAILPFKNLSDKKENQYFCDGVMEDILNRLAQVKDLRVISRTSVLRYRDTEKPLPVIAGEIGVAHILEGSIRRFDNQIRIIVKLIQAKNEKQIWSESYDKIVEDIFSIQSEIAEQIGKELEISLLPKEYQLLDYQPTDQTEAYDSFLKGRNHFHKFQEHRKEEDLETSRKYFEEAISQDPQLAAAWAHLGSLLALRHTALGASASYIDSALLAVDKAIELNPNLPEGYLFRSEVYELQKQLPRMEADLKQALSLSPNNIEILRSLGSYYSAETGELEKSIPYYKKAITLEPFNVRPLLSLSNVYRKVGNFEKAKTYLEQAAKIESDRISIYMRLADINMLQDDYDTAFKTAQTIQKINPEFIWGHHIIGETLAFNEKFKEAEKYYREIQKIVSAEGYEESFATPPFRHRLGYVLWNTGSKKEAKELFQKMMDNSLKIINSEIDNLGGARYDLAATHAFLDQPQEALKWLDRIFQDGSWFDYHYIQIDPLFSPIRNNKQFQAILDREKNNIEQMRKKVEQMEQVRFFN